MCPDVGATQACFTLLLRGCGKLHARRRDTPQFRVPQRMSMAFSAPTGKGWLRRVFCQCPLLPSEHGQAPAPRCVALSPDAEAGDQPADRGAGRQGEDASGCHPHSPRGNGMAEFRRPKTGGDRSVDRRAVRPDCAHLAGCVGSNRVHGDRALTGMPEHMSDSDKSAWRTYLQGAVWLTSAISVAIVLTCVAIVWRISSGQHLGNVRLVLDRRLRSLDDGPGVSA